MSNPSHSDIMRKLKEIKGIKELLEKAVLLYVLLTDGDLPVWCYALIIGALAYLGANRENGKNRTLRFSGQP